jgi:hypothetical protein
MDDADAPDGGLLPKKCRRPGQICSREAPALDRRPQRLRKLSRARQQQQQAEAQKNGDTH